MKPADYSVCELRRAPRPLARRGRSAPLPPMLALIDKARQSVCLESYMVRPGRAGRVACWPRCWPRARAACAVQVLYDAFGSEGLPPTFFLPLEEQGGEVRVFSPARRLRLAFRDHRKLLVCDARRAIVGGNNIGPEYAGDGVTQRLARPGAADRRPDRRDAGLAASRPCTRWRRSAPAAIRKFRAARARPARARRRRAGS